MDKPTVARYRVHIPGVDDDVRYAPPTANTRPTASGVGVVRLRMARPGAGIEVPLTVSPRSPYEEACTQSRGEYALFDTRMLGAAARVV